MTSEKSDSPEAVMTPAPETPKLFGVPMDVFVRGGTTSSAHDRAHAERVADAEARRDQAAMERQISSVPIEQGGGKTYGGALTPHQDIEQGFVELFYLNARGEQRYEFGEPVRCLADIVLADENTLELCLIMVCVKCKERGDHQGECQMKIRQSNRRWEFSQKRAGDMIPWKEELRDPLTGQTKIFKKIYKSAGTIVESEKFKCDKCNWSCLIVDNKVREA